MSGCVTFEAYRCFVGALVAGRVQPLPGFFVLVDERGTELGPRHPCPVTFEASRGRTLGVAGISLWPAEQEFVELVVPDVPRSGRRLADGRWVGRVGYGGGLLGGPVLVIFDVGEFTSGDSISIFRPPLPHDEPHDMMGP